MSCTGILFRENELYVELLRMLQPLINEGALKVISFPEGTTPTDIEACLRQKGNSEPALGGCRPIMDGTIGGIFNSVFGTYHSPALGILVTEAAQQVIVGGSQDLNKNVTELLSAAFPVKGPPQRIFICGDHILDHAPFAGGLEKWAQDYGTTKGWDPKQIDSLIHIARYYNFVPEYPKEHPKAHLFLSNATTPEFNAAKESYSDFKAGCLREIKGWISASSFKGEIILGEIASFLNITKGDWVIVDRHASRQLPGGVEGTILKFPLANFIESLDTAGLIPKDTLSEPILPLVLGAIKGYFGLDGGADQGGLLHPSAAELDLTF